MISRRRILKWFGLGAVLSIPAGCVKAYDAPAKIPPSRLQPKRPEPVVRVEASPDDTRSCQLFDRQGRVVTGVVRMQLNLEDGGRPTVELDICPVSTGLWGDTDGETRWMATIQDGELVCVDSRGELVPDVTS